MILAFPAWGVLHRVHQRPAEFYGLPFWTPQIPGFVVTLAGILALTLLCAWGLRHLRAARTGAPRSRGHALFILSHLAITAISYLAIADITRGWLFINIWHNAQYLLFVWAMNARRFAGGLDPRRPFLSRLCLSSSPPSRSKRPRVSEPQPAPARIAIPTISPSPARSLPVRPGSASAAAARLALTGCGPGPWLPVSDKGSCHVSVPSDH